MSVMEYLMAAGDAPVKQVDIARDLDISPATLNRIMKVLYDRGYVFRTSQRFVVPNFRLIKNVPMSEVYLEALDEIMEEITAQHGVYSEAVVVTGQDLYWHSRTDLDPPPVAIRAKAGFRRPLYELDAMSRLYMARLGWDWIEYQFNIATFHDNSPALRPHAPERARALIEATMGKDFDYDLEGNRVGLRRFALVVEDLDGNFLHFLTLAEAATPMADQEARIASYRHVLEGARARLTAVMEEERRAAEILRPAKMAGLG
ncbi:winged helix-turn-helix transcriptional regulator [Tropicimonas sp. IMCC6043]|nr:winged helix-turn-helix transcriptional regulator [Tropicimonas sp. IMCC6043]